MTSIPLFRLATAEDLPAITDILNQSILTGGQNAYTEPVDLTERTTWLAKHPPAKWPVFVIEDNQAVVGWCCFSAYRPERKSLAGLVEITYYLDNKYQGRGLGSATVDFLIEEASRRGFRHLFAVTMDTNTASIRLLEKKGFDRWAHLPEVAEINGQVCGQVYYGRRV
jgi:phosphinothricin acetyltransferase